jgi:hypothetical protein
MSLARRRAYPILKYKTNGLQQVSVIQETIVCKFPAGCGFTARHDAFGIRAYRCGEKERTHAETESASVPELRLDRAEGMSVCGKDHASA